jgi:hypothetical protein
MRWFGDFWTSTFYFDLVNHTIQKSSSAIWEELIEWTWMYCFKPARATWDAGGLTFEKPSCFSSEIRNILRNTYKGFLFLASMRNIKPTIRKEDAFRVKQLGMPFHKSCPKQKRILLLLSVISWGKGTHRQWSLLILWTFYARNLFSLLFWWLKRKKMFLRINEVFFYDLFLLKRQT